MATGMKRIEFASYPATSRSGTGMMAVFLMAGVVAGTGGSVNLQNIAKMGELQPNPIFEIRGNQDNRVKVRSIANHLESIRGSLGLRMSEVAEILGVSRPAVYAWMAGVEPRPELSARIRRLSRSADEVRQLGSGQLGRYLRYPVSGGRSVLDLLKAGEDIREAVLAVREIPAKESTQREMLAQSRGASRQRIVSLDEISILG